MICQGVPVRFPKLRMAFLEIGATWLPYYLDRLDEHWEKRAQYEMPLLKEKPSELVRKSEVYFSIESGESQLAHTIEYVGAEHFVYASDIPHWDCEFPENWSSSVTIRRYRWRSKKKSCQECQATLDL
jgi:predicted TIM-barrel fold metal-dependent hydrolase